MPASQTSESRCHFASFKVHVSPHIIRASNWEQPSRNLSQNFRSLKSGEFCLWNSETVRNGAWPTVGEGLKQMKEDHGDRPRKARNTQTCQTRGHQHVIQWLWLCQRNISRNTSVPSPNLFGYSPCPLHPLARTWKRHQHLMTQCWTYSNICKLFWAHKAEQKESEEGERLICANGCKVRIAETQRFSRRSTHVLGWPQTKLLRLQELQPAMEFSQSTESRDNALISWCQNVNLCQWVNHHVDKFLAATLNAMTNSRHVWAGLWSQ